MNVDHNGPDDVAEDRLRAVVESIGGHARSANLSRADRLSEALAEVAAGSLDEPARQEATEIAHQLVGSAGTFGFPEASQLAGEIERYFVEADLADPVRWRLRATRYVGCKKRWPRSRTTSPTTTSLTPPADGWCAAGAAARRPARRRPRRPGAPAS